MTTAYSPDPEKRMATGSAVEGVENALFVDWAVGRPSFHQDGIVDEPRFLEAPVKLLFLLKEVNLQKPDGSIARAELDLRAFLREGGHPRTWSNVVRWTSGVFALFAHPGQALRWTEFSESPDAGKRGAALRQIGVVNLKKSAGGQTTKVPAFGQAVKQDADRLRRQLDLYQADFTICCGSVVTHAVRKYRLLGLHEEGAQTSRGVRWYEAGQHGVLIDYAHPEARVADHLLFYGLMDAVAEIWSKRGRRPQLRG